MLSLATVAGAARRPALTLSHLLKIVALRRTRQQLARLDDYLLRDVGLTRAEARREAGQPIWNAPTHWLR